MSAFLERAKSVICVGDEKQSIYGWRGGEKKLFEDLPNILDAKVENLDTSYRSLSSIVDFTNVFFKSFPLLYQEEGIDWQFLESKSHKKQRGEVLSYFVSILARKNKTLLQIADFLEEKKIPYQLSVQKEYQEETMIDAFLSLFRYFCTGKYLYLVEFFRSSVLQASNEILKKLLTGQENMIQYIYSGKEWKEKPKGSQEVRTL